jgi:uncharacterized protein
VTEESRSDVSSSTDESALIRKARAGGNGFIGYTGGKSMKARWWTAWALAGASLLFQCAVMAAAQQDEGPILRPKKPAGATLLVLCDLACDWTLDGEAKGHIDAGDSVKAKVELGQHVVDAATQDGLDKVEKTLKIKAAGQTIVRLELAPVRNARLQTNQPAQDEDARLQDLLNHADERFKEGRALYDQKRYEEARPLFEKSCDGGDMTGCDWLGFLYENAQGVSRDYVQARTLYQKACDSGNIDACKNLGSLYDNGNGVTQDYAQASAFYRKTCDGGNLTGCNNLGYIYDSGHGVTQDYAQALTLYRKACDGELISGCFNLGVLYDKGHGVSQDYAQARTLFQKACDGGLMNGCNWLGSLYDDGHGVSRDYAQARAFYQKACDGGNMNGCYNLGYIYEHGHGVSRDREQARALFQKACDGGSKDACSDLKKLH